MRTSEPGGELPSRTVVARNTAAEELGSIHDNAYAARFGYRGGLVPGVTLLAYLTPALIEAFAEAWPQRGRLHARFVRPAYDGERLAVRATAARRDGDDVTLACRVENERGAACVEAEASCAVGDAPPERAPWRRGIPAPRPVRLVPGGGLPPLDPDAFVIGEELMPLTYRVTPDESMAWAAQMDDQSSWYREASPFGGAPIVHPAFFARDPIELLRHNFAYKATIHAETDLAYQHVAWPERDYTVYGYIADVYERKDSSYVVIQTLTVDHDGREIARNRHTSIVRLRGEHRQA